MLLYFQEATNYTLPVVILIGTILSIATGLGTFFVAKTIYKTTLPSRLAETYRANYEAEKIRADQAEARERVLIEAKRVWEAEKASLTSEYTQLSQLYARKSLILERLTGIYSNLSNLAEAGTIEEFLTALSHPIQIKRGEPGGEIHQTKG
jgi:hypothetical protein